MAYHLMKPRFPLGSIYATPGAIALGIDLIPYLHRHHCGDWGDGLCAEDKTANEHSLNDGSRLLSCYRIGRDVRIYIITEWDRSATTVMLPEEY
jgi:hypothetical protein